MMRPSLVTECVSGGDVSSCGCCVCGWGEWAVARLRHVFRHLPRSVYCSFARARACVALLAINTLVFVAFRHVLDAGELFLRMCVCCLRLSVSVYNTCIVKSGSFCCLKLFVVANDYEN